MTLMKKAVIAVASVCVLLRLVSAGSTPGYTTATVTSYTTLGKSGQSVLLQAHLSPLTPSSSSGKEQAYESSPVYVAVLRGSPSAIGFDYGAMLAAYLPPMYTAFMKHVLPSTLELDVLEGLVDWQWREFLSRRVPKEQLDEIAGIEAGCKSASVLESHDAFTSNNNASLSCSTIVARILTLANAPGDLSDFKYVLEDELLHPFSSVSSTLLSTTPALRRLKITAAYIDDILIPALREVAEKVRGCSMFGVWGQRTVDGSLYSGRNLDWTKDSGINQYKLITVYVPDQEMAITSEDTRVSRSEADGPRRRDSSPSPPPPPSPSTATSPFATVGFMGFVGALAGMSKSGLTVHEANLETRAETFRGFPWAMRLRWILERGGPSLSTVKEMWAATNNTVGFNHQVCSASDRQCMLLETMKEYSAYFGPMDPREDGATFVDPVSGKTVVFGFPSTDAVYRTNHGYDPRIREQYNWPATTGAFKDSVVRYNLLANQVQIPGMIFGVEQALNMTSIPGSKGGLDDFYKCNPVAYPKGSNILSVMFHPASQTLWAAWEDGTGESWVPAACATYVQIDLSKLW
eukprot:ANDGO_06147.mRNA.1 hypothetical protein